MAWNYMQVELAPADNMIRPVIGPGGLTHGQARAEIQVILDRTVSLAPDLPAIADQWRRNEEAVDDACAWSQFVWTVYEYDDTNPDGARRAALDWAEGVARSVRSSGLSVTVAQIP